MLEHMLWETKSSWLMFSWLLSLMQQLRGNNLTCLLTRLWPDSTKHTLSILHSKLLILTVSLINLPRLESSDSKVDSLCPWAINNKGRYAAVCFFFIVNYDMFFC